MVSVWRVFDKCFHCLLPGAAIYEQGLLHCAAKYTLVCAYWHCNIVVTVSMYTSFIIPPPQYKYWCVCVCVCVCVGGVILESLCLCLCQPFLTKLGIVVHSCLNLYPCMITFSYWVSHTHTSIHPPIHPRTSQYIHMQTHINKKILF